MWNSLRDRWAWELRHGGHEFIRKREKWFYPDTGWKRFDAIGVFWDMIERQSFQKLFVSRDNSVQTHDYWVPTEVKERILTNMLGSEECDQVMYLFEMLEWETDWMHAKFVHPPDYTKTKYPHEELSNIVEKWRIDGTDEQLTQGYKSRVSSKDNSIGVRTAA